ncbi:slipin family protein [Vibrio quintilis]|uniref:SPFH domain / Band 7 family protein n=1 Tax=Vibrio quintilis TaxID=1117707 RepID=A0A1M7Z0R0_9VIBR|nr:slipin family protein [Vibrio quintilis]SHO58256.1 SPFH domain / Band 7 family protein [Vibrio quintilis]
MSVIRMKLKNKIKVTENQRVFVLRNQQLEQVLMPGNYTFWNVGDRPEFISFDINQLFYREKNSKRLYQQSEVFREHIEHFQLNDNETGLLYLDERLSGIVAPGESVYVWKDAGDIRLERIDLSTAGMLESTLLRQIRQADVNKVTSVICSQSVNTKLINELIVPQGQLGLLYVDGKPEQCLAAGEYGFWQFNSKTEMITFDLRTPVFEWAEGESEKTASYVQPYRLDLDEAGILYINQTLKGIVAPGESVYVWKDAGDIRLDRIDVVNTIDVAPELQTLFRQTGANRASRLICSPNTIQTQPAAELRVPQAHIGLLYINGELERRLSPGEYSFWQFNRTIEMKLFDCRTQMLEISGQEILSKDRVSLRLNLNASFKITDPQLAAASLAQVEDYAYKKLQLALREAVGTKTLDDLLLDKLYINETVKALVVEQLKAVGMTLESVGVKDIILPGEMKAILNQVVEAQKAAEANVIKRREETAATRSLHNTAKVMENNPTLLRLKELEALEKVADKINNLNVYGGLEGLMNGVVKMT